MHMGFYKVHDKTRNASILNSTAVDIVHKNRRNHVLAGKCLLELVNRATRRLPRLRIGIESHGGSRVIIRKARGWKISFHQE